MAEAPRIPGMVRERLRRQPTAAFRPGMEHPDADLLTAYNENALSEQERIQVLAHMAECHDCRQIALLAQPDRVEASGAAFGTRFRSFNWMTLRWGALAAGFVLTIGVLLMNRSFRPEPTPVTERAGSQATESYVAGLRDQQVQKPAEEVDGLAAEKTPAEAKSKLEARTLATKKAVKPAAIENGFLANDKRKLSVNGRSKRQLGAEARNYDSQIAENAAPAAVAQTPLPSAPSTASGQKNRNVAGLSTGTIGRLESSSGSAGKVAALHAQASDQVAPQAAAPPASAASNPTGEVTGAVARSDIDQEWLRKNEPGKKKTASEAPAVVAGPLAARDPTQARARDNKPSRSPVGGYFETSKDQNELVTVNKEKLSPAVVSPPQWRIRGGKLQQSTDAGKNWQEVNVARGVDLHAFWSQDGNVWAGGTGGALFYVTEAGKRAVRIPIKIGDSSVSLTVVAVTFSDETHGIIMLENGQVLETANGGKTWERH